MTTIFNTPTYAASTLLLAMIVVTSSVLLAGSYSSPAADLAEQVGEKICSEIDCMQGSCKVSENAPILGFRCDCFPGWTKFQMGPLTLPFCNIPNCTINMDCGSMVPSLPSLPTHLPFNLSSDPCSLVWCGDGNCMTSGGSHVCQCNRGSTNFGGSNTLPCFQNCSLGADCQGIKLVGPSIIEPATDPTAPPTSDSNPNPYTPTPHSASNGSNKVDSNEAAAAVIKALLLASTTTLLMSCIYMVL